MRKYITLLLVLVLIVGLCACGGEKEPESIELTLENYETYLNVTSKMIESGETTILMSPSLKYSGGTRGAVCTAYGGKVEVSGASTNFNYNDVKVIVAFKGPFRVGVSSPSGYDVETREADFTVEATTDIAGNGKAVKSGMNLEKGVYTFYDFLIDVKPKIIEVSGTVTPAR